MPASIAPLLRAERDYVGSTELDAGKRPPFAARKATMQADSKNRIRERRSTPALPKLGFKGSRVPMMAIARSDQAQLWRLRPEIFRIKDCGSKSIVEGGVSVRNTIIRFG